MTCLRPSLLLLHCHWGSAALPLGVCMCSFQGSPLHHEEEDSDENHAEGAENAEEHDEEYAGTVRGASVLSVVDNADADGLGRNLLDFECRHARHPILCAHGGGAGQ